MSESVSTAYAEIGKAYQTAVDVSLFTWKMFYLRTVAVFTAAGYLGIEDDHKVLAIGLLVISATMTLVVTTSQMHDNQRVIQKLLAAGFLLEVRNIGLGYRFVHEIHLPNTKRNVTDWDGKRKELIDNYSTDLDRKWVSPNDWKYFGIYPNLTAFAIIYGMIHILFALGLLYVEATANCC
jgi:hypothetical protein